jgi:hypothetical protein
MLIEEMDDLPHGHGLSFKKGVCSILMKDLCHVDKKDLPNGHAKSFEKGRKYGLELEQRIAQKVKK